jgi:hypothetical protein
LAFGAGSNVLDGPFPPKPPKMRWLTYERSMQPFRSNGS